MWSRWKHHAHWVTTQLRYSMRVNDTTVPTAVVRADDGQRSHTCATSREETRARGMRMAFEEEGGGGRG